jgi:hypothetical protein
MPQIYNNFMSGTVTDNPLLIGSTTINSAGFASLPTIVLFADTMFLTLDPEGVNGLPEIVTVTAHAAAATSITVVRAQQSTVARAHPLATTWAHAVTKADLDDLPHQYFTGKGDSQWGAGPGQSARLAATSTNGLVLVADTATATGTKWAQVGSTGLAFDAKGIPSFADATARDAVITSPTRGMMCFLQTPGRYFVRTASAWRESGFADTYTAVRQYRAVGGGTVIANTLGVYPVTWDTELADTDAMAVPPVTSITLTEGVWAVSGTLSLAIVTGAASTYSPIPTGGGVGPYAALAFSGISTRGAASSVMPVGVSGSNFLVSSSNATFLAGVSCVVPVASATTLTLNLQVPTGPSITGTVTQTLGGNIQITQIG